MTDAAMTDQRRKHEPVRILVCRVGRQPVVEQLTPNSNGYGYLDAMQAIVGGLVQCVTLDDGVDVWCNEEALLFNPPLPINRIIPASPRSVPKLLGEEVPILYSAPGLAQPGEPGEWWFRGDFFMARIDADGEIVDIDDASIEKYTTAFEAEDIEAARRFNEIRVRLDEIRRRDHLMRNS